MKMDSLEAQGLGNGDVGGGVIDKQTFRGRAADALEQHLEDARVGLDQLDLAGDDHALEPVEECVGWADEVELLGRPVAEAEEGETGLAQAVQDLHAAGDGAAYGFREALIISVDQVAVVRVAGAQPGDGLGEGDRVGILLVIPFGEADFKQEALDGGFIAGEELAVEVARVPVQQDAAKIKDDGGCIHRGLLYHHPPRWKNNWFFLCAVYFIIRGKVEKTEPRGRGDASPRSVWRMNQKTQRVFETLWVKF